MDKNAKDVITTIESPGGTYAVHSGGAHVTKWDSATYGPLIFVSEETGYGVGTPIRGGIPLCFPWFGAATPDSEGVALLGRERATRSHGFARLVNWRQVSSLVNEVGEWKVAYELTERDIPTMPGEIRPQPFLATFEATFTDTALDLSFEVLNAGNSPFWYEAALHTYFKVGDVEKIAVNGLEGVEYVDKTVGGEVKEQNGPILFEGEVDRVYQSDGAVTIVDPVLKRQIEISKEKSGTTIVWNLGAEIAVGLKDMADAEFRDFVCVETANAAQSAITLQPGETHTMKAHYRVSSLEGSR